MYVLRGHGHDHAARIAPISPPPKLGEAAGVNQPEGADIEVELHVL